MEELERVLREQAKRYPRMEPTDAVKLIYQNEFGGGHLIRDREAALHYLRREYAAVKKDPAVPLREPIGNGIVRVNLAALAAEELEQMGQDFIRSAEEHKGNLAGFKEKLIVLRELTAKGIFGFGSEALDAYLGAYETAGFPPVSHSDAYRAAYAPAYRIVKEA